MGQVPPDGIALVPDGRIRRSLRGLVVADGDQFATPAFYLLPCGKNGKRLWLERPLRPGEEVGVLPCVRGLRAGHRATPPRGDGHCAAVLPLLYPHRNHHRQGDPGCEGKVSHIP